MRNRKSEQGVALIELVIVVFIGLVITAVAVPQIASTLHDYTMLGAGRDITRIVQLARYTAIKNNTNACTVLVGNLFGVDANCDGALGANEVSVVIPAGVTVTATGPGGGSPIYTGFNFASNPVAVASPFAITFTPRGSVTAAPAVDVIYLSGWGKFTCVTVLGTGRARSWQYNIASTIWQ